MSVVNHFFASPLYMWQRLTFRGASNPAAWSAISKAQTDLANDILADNAWEIEDLASEAYIANLPPTERLSADAPYGKALPTMVMPPPRPQGQ
jgi:hypothetical protein